MLQFIFATLSALGFAYIFNIHGKTAIATGLLGGLGWMLYLLTQELGLSLGFSFFILGAFSTLGSEIIARIFKVPVILALIPTITPFVPGSGAYYTMFYFLNENQELATKYAIDTFIMTGAMMLGFLVMSDVFRVSAKYARKKRIKSENKCD